MGRVIPSGLAVVPESCQEGHRAGVVYRPAGQDRSRCEATEGIRGSERNGNRCLASRECVAVYTVKIEDAIYVLHTFQKKSTKGIATPVREIELIRKRLADAEREHRKRRN